MSLSPSVPPLPRPASVPRLVASDRTYWGLRSPDVTADMRQRTRLFSIQIPGGAFFTHTTAARVYGIPLPPRLAREARFHVTMAAPDRAPHSRNVIGHGLKMRMHEIVDVGLVRVTSPERTWCDLGGMLALSDLVAAGDFLIHWQDPFSSQVRLANAIEELPNRRHVRILRTAVAQLSDRSDSPPESILRVVLAAGRFPPPVVTRAVFDGYGEHIAHTEFLLEELGLVLRYRSGGLRAGIETGLFDTGLLDTGLLDTGLLDGAFGEPPHSDGRGGNPLLLELDSDDLRDPLGLIDRIWTHVRTHGAPR